MLRRKQAFSPTAIMTAVIVSVLSFWRGARSPLIPIGFLLLALVLLCWAG